MRRGEGEQPEQRRAFRGWVAQFAALCVEGVGDRPQQGGLRGPVIVVPARRGRTAHPDRGHQLKDRAVAPAQDVYEGDHVVKELEGLVQGSNLSDDGVGAQLDLDHSIDDRVLVGKDVEQRALGNFGRSGDLAGGDRPSVLSDQRGGRSDDGRSPFVWRHPLGAGKRAGMGLSDRHPGTLIE